MGTTATSLCKETRRFDFGFLDNEFELMCDSADSWLKRVKLPREANAEK